MPLSVRTIISCAVLSVRLLSACSKTSAAGPDPQKLAACVPISH